MLDLDSLAEECARAVNEKQEQWSNVIWGADFQTLAKNMTDGEVTALLKACRSLTQLQDVLEFLMVDMRMEIGGGSPFAIVASEAKASGKSLGDWIASLSGKV